MLIDGQHENARAAGQKARRVVPGLGWASSGVIGELAKREECLPMAERRALAFFADVIAR
jgi:hypothetical protein